MRMTFGPNADAMYIYIREEPSARTQELGNYQTMVDFDKRGKVIGIELLDVSERFPADFVKELKLAENFGQVPVEILGGREIPPD